MIFSRLAPVCVVAVILLTGCAATTTGTVAASAPPTASAGAPEPHLTPTWTPDLVVALEFATDEGDVSCTIVMRVVEPSGANDELSGRIDDARAFLAAGDWSSDEVSLEEFDDDELVTRRAQGVSDAELMSMLVQDHIYQDMKAAGVLGEGISTESFADCDG